MRVMCANEALINNRRILHSSSRSAGDLVPYLPIASSVRTTLYKTECVCWLCQTAFVWAALVYMES